MHSTGEARRSLRLFRHKVLPVERRLNLHSGVRKISKSRYSRLSRRIFPLLGAVDFGNSSNKQELPQDRSLDVEVKSTFRTRRRWAAAVMSSEVCPAATHQNPTNRAGSSSAEQELAGATRS